jgi:fluoroacetyl-CoA thioesterase
MKEELSEGMTDTGRIEVDRARTIDFMGEENRVYATPALLRDIEMTCRNFLLKYTDEGKDSVGVRVELDHIAATLQGMWVDITITVNKIDGPMVSFGFECRDEIEKVALGVHKRFVVGVEKTAARLAGKRAKLG